MTDDEKDELLATLAEAFLERIRKGEGISVEDYAAAHPELADDLRELLPVMLDVEGVGRTTQPPAPHLAHYPERLGDYRLLSRIGSGGMGTVFRALQESLHREVAVKILAPSWSADPKHSEAFEKESRVIAALRHTNIVEVFGAGHEGPYRYYVMGLVKGQGVSAGRLGVAFPGVPYDKAVARVGLQAARALSFAHKHGVVHRDVKPGNLLLDNSGVLQVSDFGLATVLNAGEDAPLVTQSHDGTLRYMAPERLMKGINSFTGDQYSLGLTLYELLTRAPVFRETEPGTLVRNICNGSLPVLKGYGELGAIINKAVSYEPADRYASMADMADDLQRFLNGEPVKARAASCFRRYVLWVRRRPAVAFWSHAAAVSVLLLFTSVSIGLASVSRSLKSENEQRLIAEQNAQRADTALRNENEQRLLAERNEQIADACLQRIFASMVLQNGEESAAFSPTQADARLLQDLMPYYEQLVAGAESGDDKVTGAASILATIALQTGDFETSETYFRRVADASHPGSYAHVEATIGLATAIYSQGEQRRVDEAISLLRGLESLVPDSADFETGLRLVRALQMAYTLSVRPHALRFHSPAAARHRTPGGANAELDALSVRTATLLQRLLEQQPDNQQACLLRVEMLAAPIAPAARRLLAPQGQSAQGYLEKVLEKSPDSQDAKRLYLRLVNRNLRNNSDAAASDLSRAVTYAGALLAANPTDSELIMLFLTVRDRYALQLSQQGQSEQAARENERTLAILSFLTERADFTPAIRERLVMLVAMHPQHEEGRSQQEEELRTLLQDYDDERIKALRLRMQRMRANPHGPRRRPGRPRHGGTRPRTLSPASSN